MEIILSMVIGLVIGYIAGNFKRETVESIKDLKKSMEAKRDKPIIDDTTKSTIVDPLDEAAEARRRYQQQMEDLNPYE